MKNKRKIIGKLRYVIKVDEITFKLINNYKLFKQYKNRYQATEELIRIGFNYLKEKQRYNG